MILTIKDFQSWGPSQTTLKIEGFTVVTGDSNLGKSSLSRAIRGVIRNEISAAQIRIGSTGVEVNLTNLDGHHIKATRKAKGSVDYIIDDQEYSKLNGAIPDSLEKLNLGIINIGDVGLDPIFASQFSSQFMLEEKPGPLNAILGAFSSTEKLEAGKRAGKTRIADCNSQSKALAIEVRGSFERQEKLQDLKSRGDSLSITIGQLDKLTETQDKVVDQCSGLIHTKEELEWLSSVVEGSRVDATLYDTCVALHNRVEILALSVASHIRLAKLKALTSSLPDLSVVLQRSAKGHSIVDMIDNILKAKARTGKASAIIVEVEKVVSSWTGIVGTHKKQKKLGEHLTYLSNISSGPSKEYLDKLKFLSHSIGTFSVAAGSDATKLSAINGLLGYRSDLTKKLAMQELVNNSLKIELGVELGLKKELEAANDRCDKCGSELKGNHNHA